MKILKYLIILCVLLYTQIAYAEQYKKWNNTIINKNSVRTVTMHTSNVDNSICINYGYGNYIYFKYKDSTETKKAFNNFYIWLNERK